MRRTGRFNDLDVRAWMRFTRSWFICNPPPRTAAQRSHPAKFPEALAREFIEFFSRPGETVLDPFSGVGSAVSAAAALGRRGVGIELASAFRDAALDARRGAAAEETYILGDAAQAVPLCAAAGVDEVHYVLTSPPYWNMLLEGRGNVRSTRRMREDCGLATSYPLDPRDLGAIAGYDEFIQALTTILAGLRPLLSGGRYLTVILQNVRVRSGEVRPLAWDVVRALGRFYTFKGERVWLQENKRLGCWGWPSEFVTNVHHHYCLVFKNDRGLGPDSSTS